MFKIRSVIFDRKALRSGTPVGLANRLCVATLDVFEFSLLFLFVVTLRCLALLFVCIVFEFCAVFLSVDWM